MELIGSLFLIAGLALVVILFITRPLLRHTPVDQEGDNAEITLDHQRSALMAERDRVITSLQELDFDNTLGKVPVEEYQEQRVALLKTGADTLRRLDVLGRGAAVPPVGAPPESQAEDTQPAVVDATVEARIEAAVAARRADLARATAKAGAPLPAAAAEGQPTNGKGQNRDALEDLIAARKRQRNESAAGFCPRCGRPVQKSDKFCSRCGADL